MALFLLAAGAGRLLRHRSFLNPRYFATTYSSSDPETSAPVWDSRCPIRAPPDEQFAAWVTRLRPDFTACNLADAISEPDPDLALALFHWAALCPGFRHALASYLAALNAASSGKHPAAAENLIHDVHREF